MMKMAGGNPNQAGLRIASAKGVEIVDAKGSTLGEFDEINNGQFIEDKLAKGLNTTHPKTGLPVQTAEQWASKQIYSKSVVRIDNLAHANATRPTVGGTPNVPSLGQIKGIKDLKFRIDSKAPDVQSATEVQLQRLRAKYPDWTFSAEYGS